MHLLEEFAVLELEGLEEALVAKEALELAPEGVLEGAPEAAPEAAPAPNQGNRIDQSKIVTESPDGMCNCTSLDHL